MRRFTWLVHFLLLVALLSGCVWADAPPVPEGNRTICSLGGTHCAFLLFDAKKLEVWKVAKGARHRKLAKLYGMEGWYPNVAVSEDGQNLIVANKDGNLLDAGYQGDPVLLSFYHHGQKVRDVRLSELVRDRGALERTESHYQWCRSYGLETSGRYVVNTLDGRRLVYDPGTGKAAK